MSQNDRGGFLKIDDWNGLINNDTNDTLESIDYSFLGNQPHRHLSSDVSNRLQTNYEAGRTCFEGDTIVFGAGQNYTEASYTSGLPGEHFSGDMCPGNELVIGIKDNHQYVNTTFDPSYNYLCQLNRPHPWSTSMTFVPLYSIKPCNDTIKSKALPKVQPSTSSPLSTGEIIGTAIGSILGLWVLFKLIQRYLRQQQRNRDAAEVSQEAEEQQNAAHNRVLFPPLADVIRRIRTQANIEHNPNLQLVQIVSDEPPVSELTGLIAQNFQSVQISNNQLAQNSKNWKPIELKNVVDLKDVDFSNIDIERLVKIFKDGFNVDRWYSSLAKLTDYNTLRETNQAEMYKIINNTVWSTQGLLLASETNKLFLYYDQKTAAFLLDLDFLLDLAKEGKAPEGKAPKDKEKSNQDLQSKRYIKLPDKDLITLWQIMGDMALSPENYHAMLPKSTSIMQDKFIEQLAQQTKALLEEKKLKDSHKEPKYETIPEVDPSEEEDPFASKHSLSTGPSTPDSHVFKHHQTVKPNNDEFNLGDKENCGINLTSLNLSFNPGISSQRIINRDDVQDYGSHERSKSWSASSNLSKTQPEERKNQNQTLNVANISDKADSRSSQQPRSNILIIPNSNTIPQYTNKSI